MMTLLSTAVVAPVPPGPGILVGARPARYPAPMPVADSTLEQRFVAGDERALAEVFAEHSGIVLGLARKAVGAEADDVAQQVFVAAWKGRHRFDAERGSLRSLIPSHCFKRRPIAPIKIVDSVALLVFL